MFPAVHEFGATALGISLSITKQSSVNHITTDAQLPTVVAMWHPMPAHGLDHPTDELHWLQSDAAEIVMQFAGAVLQGRHPNTTIGLNSVLSSAVDVIGLAMID
jgi:hypothetical protein